MNESIKNNHFKNKETPKEMKIHGKQHSNDIITEKGVRYLRNA